MPHPLPHERPSTVAEPPVAACTTTVIGLKYARNEADCVSEATQTGFVPAHGDGNRGSYVPHVTNRPPYERAVTRMPCVTPGGNRYAQ